MVLTPGPQLEPSSFMSFDSDSSASDLQSSELALSTPCNIVSDYDPLSFVLAASKTLLITNLARQIFSTISDLDGLLRPFGSIVKMFFLNSPNKIAHTNSVMVEYDFASSAQEAREILSGQFYAGHAIMLTYVGSPDARRPSQIPSGDNSLGGNMNISFSTSGNRDNISLPLNPHAAPFVLYPHVESHSSTHSYQYMAFNDHIPGVTSNSETLSHSRYQSLELQQRCTLATPQLYGPYNHPGHQMHNPSNPEDGLMCVLSFFLIVCDILKSHIPAGTFILAAIF